MLNRRAFSGRRRALCYTEGNASLLSERSRMDTGFKTLGECDFGTVWFVEHEGKIVVNAYQAALYFGVDEFMQFAGMIGEARKRLGGAPEPEPKREAGSSKIRQFPGSRGE